MYARALQAVRLAVLLAAANALAVFAAATPLDGLRGRLDLTQCKKPCSENTFPIHECDHNNDEGDDWCRTTSCLETNRYYAACAGRTGASDPQDCNLTQEWGEIKHQQVRVTAGQTCFDQGWEYHRDHFSNFPLDGDCQNPGQDDARGKCYMDACVGTDVDFIEGAFYQKSYFGMRYVCGS